MLLYNSEHNLLNASSYLTMAQPSCVLASNTAQTEPRIVFNTRYLAAKQVVVHPGLGFALMFNSYDYISLFASSFDIPVSLNDLFQRIASINYRFYLLSLDKLFEEK